MTQHSIEIPTEEDLDSKEAPVEPILKPLDFLAMIGDCEEIDIQKFRNSLGPEGKIVFDMMNETRQHLMSALDRLSKKQINDLQKSVTYMVGLHDLNNLLFIFHILREVDEDKCIKSL